MKQGNLWALALAGLCAVFVSQGVAFAARDTEVGSEEERLRRPRPLEVPERRIIPIELPPEGELPPEAEKAPPVTVRAVIVEGGTLLSQEEQDRLTAPVIGKTVTLRELREVALAITRWYRGKGYVTSRAIIPAQSVERGVVRIRVIEGKAGKVRIEGNKHFKTELLSRYVRLQEGDFLYMPRLEEALGALNAHPDRKVKLVLAPSAQPETTDLVMQVSDRPPVHASYGVDTLGPKSTGEWRQSVLVSHGNITGHDDQVTVRGLVSEGKGLWGGAMSYLLPTASGFTGTFEVSGVKSQVGDNLKGLLARGNAVTVSPGFIWPFFRRTHWEMEAVGGMDWKRIRTFADDVSTSKDDLRVARFAVNMIEQDDHGSSLLVEELRVGLGNFLGGSHPEDPAAARAEAGGSFVRWIGSAIRVQQVPWKKSSLVARFSGQVSSDRLEPAEQFRLGGFETVRGYPEGEFLADAGYQSTLEFRTPLEEWVPGPQEEKALLNRLRKSLLLVAFWDFAEGFQRNTPTEKEDMLLSGVGCGFRLRPTPESVFQVDWGWAVGDADTEKDKPRIHLIGRIGF